MTINEFIQKAVDGGYKYHGDKLLYDEQVGQWFVRNGNGGYFMSCIEVVFLDFNAWMFVSRTEGWAELVELPGNKVVDKSAKIAKLRMLSMISALCDGKSLEEYIETL
jgi:hypothetical protein